jgi:hypothetical protein
MANVVEETGWYSSIVELNILPVNLHYIIRMISWFFVSPSPRSHVLDC